MTFYETASAYIVGVYASLLVCAGITFALAFHARAQETRRAARRARLCRVLGVEL
jgi:hypothetical protein